MIRIAICEDEQTLSARLSGWVSSILDRHSIAYSIETYQNGSALLAREPYDILLLDIEMEPMNGLELAGKLRARGDESRLVFITAHAQYAVDAYDVHPFHYMIKPVDIEKLEKIFLQLHASLCEERSRAVIVRQGTAVRRVPLEQILYLEVLDRKIYLHTSEETVPFYGKLEDLEPALTSPSPASGSTAFTLQYSKAPNTAEAIPQPGSTVSGFAASAKHASSKAAAVPALPGTFFRCHRSYIVNLRHVQYYDKNEIRLDSEERIPLSKRRYKSFGLAFMHYLKESGDVL